MQCKSDWGQHTRRIPQRSVGMQHTSVQSSVQRRGDSVLQRQLQLAKKLLICCTRSHSFSTLADKANKAATLQVTYSRARESESRASFAAATPALRPKTVPDVSPLPPG